MESVSKRTAHLGGRGVWGMPSDLASLSKHEAFRKVSHPCAPQNPAHKTCYSSLGELAPGNWKKSGNDGWFVCLGFQAGIIAQARRVSILWVQSSKVKLQQPSLQLCHCCTSRDAAAETRSALVIYGDISLVASVSNWDSRDRDPQHAGPRRGLCTLAVIRSLALY